MQKRTYSGISAERFAAIVAAAKSKVGIDISGNVGSAERDGITISWAYNPAGQSLTLTPNKAWFDVVSESTIDADLDALVNGTEGTA